MQHENCTNSCSNSVFYQPFNLSGEYICDSFNVDNPSSEIYLNFRPKQIIESENEC